EKKGIIHALDECSVKKCRSTNVECRRNDQARMIVGRFCETPRRLTQTRYNSSFGFRHSLPMPYTYLEETAPADIAFEATGRDLPELFSAAADATTNVMIDNIEAIESRETRQIELSNEKLDMLLFDVLQELIFLKDAER